METAARKSRWTFERIARLGFLIGSGWDQERISRDPIIASNPRNLQRQANRYGLAFNDVAASSPLRLTPKRLAVFDKGAAKRGMTRDALIRILLTEIADEPCLLDNILDDGE